MKTIKGSFTDVGSMIRKERELKGVTVEAFARDHGLSKSLMKKIESGKKLPDMFTLFRICSALNVTIWLEF